MSTSLPPVLVGNQITGDATHTVIDLEFSEQIERGSGSIIITDGALQTVIDRATGLPTLRVVGATQTVQVPLSQVGIDGNHALVNADNLTAGHQYSVFIAPGVLASNGMPFAGVTNAAQLSFVAVDKQPPTLSSIAIGGATPLLNANSTVTIKFSEPVHLDPAAVVAPHANISNWQTSDGITWTASLVPITGDVASGNTLTVNMALVTDNAGNAGAGVINAPTQYDVNQPVPAALTASISLDHAQLMSGGSIFATIQFSEQVPNFSIEQISAPNAALDHLHSTDGGTTWYVEVEPQTSGIYATTNTLSFDLSRVTSSTGHSGSGTAASGNYVVDTMVSSYADPFIALSDDAGYLPYDLVTNDASTAIAGSFHGALGATARLQVSIDGVQVDATKLTIAPDSSGTGVYSWHYAGGAPLAEGSHTVSVQIVDGEHASAAVSKSLTIDTSAPSVTSASPEGSPFDVAKPIVITFDQPVYWHSVFTPDPETSAPVMRQEDNRIKVVDQLGQALWIPISTANLSADGKTLTISANELQLATGTTYDLTLPAALTDLAGNAVLGHTVHFTTTGVFADTIAPHALAAAVENSSGEYGIGQTVRIDVQFDEPMKLAGSTKPTLALNNGATATFGGLSDDGRTAFFDYSIGTNDQQPTNNAQGWIDLAGTSSLAGAFTDLAGNALTSGNIAFTKLGELTGYLDGSGINIDTTVPNTLAALALDAGMDTGTVADCITSINSPVFHGSGAQPLATVDLYDIVSGYRDWIGYASADGDGNWTLDLKNAFGEGAPSHLSDGVHQLVAVQVEASGNESTNSVPLQITVDTGAMAPVISPLDSSSDTNTPGDWITAVRQPTLHGTAEAGAKIDIFDGTQLVDSTVADANGAWTFAFKADLGDGVHNLSIRQTDVAGNTSALALQALTIDTTAPGALTGLMLDAGSDSGSSQNDRITNITTPTFTGGGAEANATIELYEGDTLLGHATTSAAGTWSVAPDAQHVLSDGVHALSVRQVDAAGNAGAKSATISVTIDTAAPTVTGWTSSVLLGTNFEIWFSEPVVHSGLTNYADVNDNVTGALFHFALGNPGSWDDNAVRDGHATSVWHFMPSDAGWVELELTGVQDLAGNIATIPRAHYEFSVPVTSILPPPVL